jgi:hypothetical protein
MDPLAGARTLGLVIDLLMIVAMVGAMGLMFALVAWFDRI